jgi:hypothetical protein
MDKLKITFAYETNGKSKLIEFSPVSYSSLKKKSTLLEFRKGLKEYFKESHLRL